MYLPVFPKEDQQHLCEVFEVIHNERLPIHLANAEKLKKSTYRDFAHLANPNAAKELEKRTDAELQEAARTAAIADATVYALLYALKRYGIKDLALKKSS